MQTIRITTAQNIDIDYELSGLGERIVARIIDLTLFGVILIFTIISGISIGMNDAAGVVAVIVYAFLFVFYDLLCEILMNGQSVGKKVMKIKVMSLDGARPRLSQYLLRWLFRIIDFGIGFGAIAIVVAALSERIQRIGDMVAGTILIRTVPRTGMNNVAFRPADTDYQPVFMAAAQLNDNDVELINEVINTYIKTQNSVLVYNMALRIKQRLGITLSEGMNDMQFLQTILKDYSYLVAAAHTGSI